MASRRNIEQDKKAKILALGIAVAIAGVIAGVYISYKRQKMEWWKSSDGSNIKLTGEEKIQDGTPSQTLNEFMSAWKTGEAETLQKLVTYELYQKF
jgi:cytochrome c biogenesis protein ResB